MSTSQIAPHISRSVIDLKSFSSHQIYSLFDQCLKLKSKFNKSAIKNYQLKGTAALLFLEPSTRTRFSFESATVRAGFHPLVLEGAAGTSLEKGESFEDTVLNLEAMRPLFFVIRAPQHYNLFRLLEFIKTPILNAGWGKLAHPTQALLDAVTVFEKLGSLQQKNILFVGDISHSRVVSSHLELAKILDYNIAYCAPQFLLPQNQNENITHFKSLKEGLSWAHAVVALRVQKERHAESLRQHQQEFATQLNEFILTQENINYLSPEGLIMHPGPINYGTEITHEVSRDSRSVILSQVENGTFLREVLIRHITDEVTL